ncbi:MAG: hypothetical protein AB3N63_02055 [Puniceicoccaceae bacterium]
MSNEDANQTPAADEESLDLSSLSSMSLGPDWGSGKAPKVKLPKDSYEERPKGRRGPPRDRSGAPPRKRFEKGGRRERPEGGGGGRGDRRERRERPERRERFTKPEPFEPIIAADFYPDEEPFKVLAQAIKTSCRTFELFEIARLILDKPDRWVCVVRDPAQKEGETARLHASVPDGLPFASEEEALAHTFRHYMEDFFTVEEVEIDPPSGTFQMVHKCGMTGELLAPPNYHRYQAICREHHAARLSHVPYERFEQRIEGTREEEDIQAWLTKMKTTTRYTSKENPELVFDNQEDARLHMVTQAKDKLVRPAYSARFSGKALALLNPRDQIRRSVEYLLEGQKRFPLDTANHLRGRLRRMHFAVYKRGSKGISFVCAVKRHFRKPDEVLADNLQNLIDFLEAHPNFPAKDLPKAYLGVEEAKPEKAEKPEPKEAPKEEEAAEAPEAADAAEAAESKEEPAAAEEPAAKGPTPEEQESLKQLKTDLHYLVSQGYVIEYSDGRLFVPPVREDEIRHLEKVKAAEEKAAEEKAKAAAADAEPKAEEGEEPKAEEAEADEPKVDEAEEPKEKEAKPEPEEAAVVAEEPKVEEAEHAEEPKAEEAKAEAEPEIAAEPEPVKEEEAEIPEVEAVEPEELVKVKDKVKVKEAEAEAEEEQEAEAEEEQEVEKKDEGS